MIWGAFVPWVFGCGYYLTAILRAGTRVHRIGLWQKVLIGYVAASGGVTMIAVASVSRKSRVDERARLIEYKGYKAAYLTVETVFAWWLLGWYLPQNSKEPHKELPLLLAGWLAVEAIRVGTQLTLYRTSVRV